MLINTDICNVEYAIVDIETTGGFGAKNKITEIAIIIHNGTEELDRYQSLVNPESYIPQNITALTGITNEMVEDAPRFFEIAKTVWDYTEGRIFVAHNVSFDYNIIKNEFKELGAKFQRKKLCTVRLSRKIIPGKKSYSLGNLCESLDIPISNRHRAMGDTEATALLFKLLFQGDSSTSFDSELKALNKEAKLPAQLSADVYNNLPEKTGVYYFYNTNKEVIYVGKAKNIKKRITQHFTNVDASSRKNNMIRDIADISYEITGSELVSLLLESEEIKVLAPRFNRAQKRIRYNVGIVQYEDQSGYKRLAIEKKSGSQSPRYLRFTTISEARAFINKILKEGDLCGKLTGLQTVNGPCFEYQLKKCNGACVKKEPPQHYNLRLKSVLENYALNSSSYFIKDIGRQSDEYSVIWVQNGQYKGYGFFNNWELNEAAIKDSIKKSMDNRDVIGIIKSFLKNKDLEIIHLQDDTSPGMLF